MNEPHHVRWKSMISLGILGVFLGLFMLFFSNFASQIMVALAGFAIVLLSAIFIVEDSALTLRAGPAGRSLLSGAGTHTGIISIAVPSIIVFSTGLLLGIFS